MRVITGLLKGRQFDSPPGHRTHPMSDKIRGALFNALGDLGGLTVLDAFAGSGALGFEAISRGAVHVTALDIDRNAISTVVNNARALGIADQLKASRVGVSSWLDTQEEAMFDLVLLDPPYDDLQTASLQRAAARTTPGGLVVVSLPPTVDFALDRALFQLMSHKSYGDAQLWFYRRLV